MTKESAEKALETAKGLNPAPHDADVVHLLSFLGACVEFLPRATKTRTGSDAGRRRSK